MEDVDADRLAVVSAGAGLGRVWTAWKPIAVALYNSQETRLGIDKAGAMWVQMKAKGWPRIPKAWKVGTIPAGVEGLDAPVRGPYPYM